MGDGARLAALAGFASSVDAGRLPEVVRAKARLVLLDGLAAMFSAAAAGLNAAAIAALEPGADGDGKAIVVGGRTGAPAEVAAFLNAATAAHAIANDTHLASATHPGMVIVPAVLAAARCEGASGSAMLAAVVAGYEVMVRAGLAVVTPELTRTFRPTGLTGPLGAAAAISRLFALSPEQTAHAVALAANTSGGVNEWARLGTDEHVFHAGNAASSGIRMARLARGGVVAACSTLEGASGMLAAFGARERANHLDEALGATFHMLDVVHKPVPACVFVQVPAMLALDLAGRPGFDPAGVEAVEIAVSQQAATFPGCDNPGPIRSPAAAQQSLQFSVAAVLSRGGIDDGDWSRTTDAGVDALSSRCSVVIDQDAAGASGSGARVSIATRKGAAASASALAFAGMTADAVVDASWRPQAVSTAPWPRTRCSMPSSPSRRQARRTGWPRQWPGSRLTGAEGSEIRALERLAENLDVMAHLRLGAVRIATANGLDDWFVRVLDVLLVVAAVARGQIPQPRAEQPVGRDRGGEMLVVRG